MPSNHEPVRDSEPDHEWRVPFDMVDGTRDLRFEYYSSRASDANDYAWGSQNSSLEQVGINPEDYSQFATAPSDVVYSAQILDPRHNPLEPYRENHVDDFDAASNTSLSWQNGSVSSTSELDTTPTESRQHDDRFVVGIDFGTTFSGLAWVHTGLEAIGERCPIVTDWVGRGVKRARDGVRGRHGDLEEAPDRGYLPLERLVCHFHGNKPGSFERTCELSPEAQPILGYETAEKRNTNVLRHILRSHRGGSASCGHSERSSSAWKLDIWASCVDVITSFCMGASAMVMYKFEEGRRRYQSSGGSNQHLDDLDPMLQHSTSNTWSTTDQSARNLSGWIFSADSNHPIPLVTMAASVMIYSVLIGREYYHMRDKRSVDAILVTFNASALVLGLLNGVDLQGIIFEILPFCTLAAIMIGKWL